MQMISLITPTEADPNKKSRLRPERHGNACFWRALTLSSFYKLNCIHVFLSKMLYNIIDKYDLLKKRLKTVFSKSF